MIHDFSALMAIVLSKFAALYHILLLRQTDIPSRTTSFHTQRTLSTKDKNAIARIRIMASLNPADTRSARQRLRDDVEAAIEEHRLDLLEVVELPCNMTEVITMAAFLCDEE